ncbi:MAG: M48 family metalloprotease [Puia sp.]|nr:M48 family metalloprotease [Puia sp.]
MRGPLSFLCLVSISCLYSQFILAQDKNFYPTTEDTVLLARLAAQYQQHYKEELDKLPRKNYKDFADIYTLRWENVKEKFDKREIYTVPAAQRYLDAIVAEIAKGNPVLRDRSFACYFSRSAVPNAAYIGEGIIVFNMGLFYRLDNESQAAFILCHELAHFLLQHAENSMNKYVATINSEEIQAQLRKIKATEYHKHAQVQDLVKGLTFDSRRHSRDHESEADSMGVVLMSHTRFGVSGAPAALAILDSIDVDTLNTARCLPAVFNAKEYPFRKKWLHKEEGLLGGHAKLRGEEMADSLKTHPDCKLRIKLLEPFVSGARQTVAGKWVVDSTVFATLRDRFRYEVIEYDFLSDYYTGSLYYSLELLQQHPGDNYLVANIGRLLGGIYEAQKAHRLSQVADLPSPDYPANYNLLLQFIQNLYLEDIASIDYYYLSQYHPGMDPYKLFRKAYEQSERNMKQ